MHKIVVSILDVTPISYLCYLLSQIKWNDSAFLFGHAIYADAPFSFDMVDAPFL
jgi:hypothetical protein